MKKYIQLLTLIIAICLTVSSCKKDKDEAATPTTITGKGTIAFHFHTNVDTVEVEDYDSVYVLTGGRNITVSKAQLYISNIQLVKLDGSTVDVAGTQLIKQGEEEYTIGDAPAGNYKSVKFNVGLGATANATAPASADSVLNQPAMWFGNPPQTSGGFVFVNFQGTIDTTTAANGTVMVPFSYKIGTNTNLKNVTLPDQNFTVSPNQIQFVHMYIDYAMLFDGVQLNNINKLSMNTVVDNATALGTQLANNIAMMFSYE